MSAITSSRKLVTATKAMKSLTKGEAKASNEIQKEIDFCEMYKTELRLIMYQCQQLAKAQDDLLVLTGKLNTEDRIEHRRQIENKLLATAFDAVYNYND